MGAFNLARANRPALLEGEVIMELSGTIFDILESGSHGSVFFFSGRRFLKFLEPVNLALSLSLFKTRF